MSLESPVSVIYSSAGEEVSLSQSMPIATTQPGLMVAGSSSIGATFIRMSDQGDIFITGSINAIASGIQEVTGTVHIDNLFNYVTGTNSALIVNQGLSASNFSDAWKVVLTDASGSIFGTEASPLWTTGSVTVTNTVNVNVLNTITASISGTVTNKPLAATTTIVSSANASVTNYTLLATNSNRCLATFYKNGSGICYLKLGAVASATSYTVQLKADSYYELPTDYTGRVDIIFSTAAAASNIVVTEINY